MNNLREAVEEVKDLISDMCLPTPDHIKAMELLLSTAQDVLEGRLVRTMNEEELRKFLQGFMMSRERVYDLVYKHISDMLDHPDDYGIYPTTKCYNELTDAILGKECSNPMCKDGMIPISIVVGRKLETKYIRCPNCIGNINPLDLRDNQGGGTGKGGG